VPYVDKLKSVKNTGVSQPRWAIWREIWKWSCIPSLLYCISRKNVDTEYTYYSWCMTSTDIVKWRKNEWLWKFWKRNDLHEILKKRGGGVVEKGGRRKQNTCPKRLWFFQQRYDNTLNVAVKVLTCLGFSKPSWNRPGICRTWMCRYIWEKLIRTSLQIRWEVCFMLHLSYYLLLLLLLGRKYKPWSE
jgi:hypothetical protein